MESASDKRFDTNLAVDMLLDVAQARSLDDLFVNFVENALGNPRHACVQVWLIDKGDLCATCPQRPACPDQSRCLHLVAASGKSISTSGKQQCPFEAIDSRVPLGVGPIGETVAAGQGKGFLVSDETPASLPGLEWLREEGIRGYRIVPIRFKGEPLGAAVAFTRGDLHEEIGNWGRIFADHLGAAIANAQAFQEIQRLKAQLELQNSYLQEAVVEAKAFGDLVGPSAALRHIVSQIDLVAPTEASILILGETGTGKELVAHEIHRRSKRKDGPLVRVNCASIPRELFESEFFGHRRGSFTGAVRDRAGRFETAEGGTIFLDEVGEIPMDVQNKLLRVLQEKCYERVGDDHTRRADVRVIAATNRDLKQAIAAGRFREDLYYRLNVFPIQVTPLRERLDDVPLLAKHFVGLSTRDLKTAKPRLTRAGIAKLQDYDWPGNVRELRNVIERAVILARGGALDFELPIASRPLPAPSAVRAGDVPEPGYFTEAELQRRERDNLWLVLQSANWKIKGPDGAAERLGVKPTTLLSRMGKWGLKKPAE
ncbi:MAG: hydrogenase [Lentisphaerae bacterium RIFOXYC12_FULL_60_16]|nr:MAG: hydrogenase [Lentisphaerae bacterium RIFOXYC12_FULL_60_16]OGV76069.1 MAG: hydrogenase [Lentisphaerae bacterium RIFOXYB12_FULL_60_10]